MVPRAYAVAFATAVACACNALTGASDLEPSGESSCVGCPNVDGGPADGAIDLGDGAIVSDAQKDGDDLTPGGFLDATWGTSGVATSTLLDVAYDVAVSSAGEAYVVGRSGTHLAVVRFDLGGVVDKSFGDGGRLDVTMGSATGGSLPNLVVPEPGAGIAIDGKGRVVVGGTSQETQVAQSPDGGATIYTYERYLFAARIANGALDPTFGQGGKYRPSPPVNGEGARAVAIAPDERVYLVGSAPDGAFAVWRLTASGNADPAFGEGGRAVVDVPAATPAVAAAANDATVLAAGGSSGAFAVAGLGPAGDPVALGDAGFAVADVGPKEDRAFAVAALPDGKIVVGGSTSVSSTRSPIFAVARLSPSGALDPSFGDRGIATFDFDNGGVWKNANDDLRGLVLDSRGRVVVAGWVEEKPQTGPPVSRAVLARLTSAGALDDLFGVGGRISFTNLNKPNYRASALARAPNGSLLVAGNLEGGGAFFVARIIP